MNLAQKLNEEESETATPLQVDTECSNIISLAQQGLLLYSPDSHQLPPEFIDHENSPLNEW
jgi:hypothetical protein